TAAVYCALHSRLVRNVFDLTTESFDQLHLFDCKAARDAENNTITARHSYESKTDAGVAGGGVDDRRARVKQTFFFGVENHAEGSAILYGTAGVHPFELCVDVSEWRLCETGEMQ